MRKIFATLLVAVGTTFAHANLVNGSFEDPVMAPGSFSSSGINGWSVGGGASGVWNIPSGSFITIEAPHGEQIGYTNTPSIAQVSSAVLALGTNTISGFGLRRNDSISGSFELKLYAGGSVASGVVTGGTLIATAVYDHTTQAPNSFQAISAEYTALAGDPLLGQTLVVQIFHTSGNQADFDDIRINGVPEPATLVALAIGSLAIAKRRRK